MLTCLHSTFDIIAHMKGKQMDLQERLAVWDFLSVHTPTLLNQMHLETLPEHQVYVSHVTLATSSVKLQTQY